MNKNYDLHTLDKFWALTENIKLAISEQLEKRLNNEVTVHLYNIIKDIENLKLADINFDNLSKFSLDFLLEIDEFMMIAVGMSSKSVVDEYISKKLMNEEYCSQGGYGHHIFSQQHKFPCHWCVKPEYYEICKPSVFVRISMLVDERKIEINPIAEKEKWGS